MAGGTTSYFGYEYQFYVSIWLMLLAHKKQNSTFLSMGIETLFGQDAEMLIGNEPLEQNEKSLNLVQDLNGYSLQVQVKTRLRNNQWAKGDIRHLLLKKDETKPKGEGETVIERLTRNPNEIFIFITNGVVSPKLSKLLNKLPDVIETGIFQRSFSDEEINEIKTELLSGKSDAKNKKFLEKHLTSEVIKRIHIDDALDIDNLQMQIETILEREYRIQPYAKTQEVLFSLLNRVRDAALGNKSNIYTDELTSIIGNTSPQLPFQDIDLIFQKTTNYDLAADKLNENHLVLLVGEPGVGKSTIGRKLVNDFFDKKYGWDVIPNGNYREVYKVCQDSAPMILLMDDPFGDTVFNNNTSFGNSLFEITNQLNAANGKVKLIITTRRNVLSEVVKSTKLSLLGLKPFRVDVSEPTINVLIHLPP